MVKQKGSAKIVNTADPEFAKVKAQVMEDLRSNAASVIEELSSEKCIGFITVVATDEGDGNFSISRAAGAGGQPTVTIEMLEVLSDLGNDVAASFGKSLRDHEEKEKKDGGN